METNLILGLVYCGAVLFGIGFLLGGMCWWGNRHAEWTDKQCRRVAK